MESGDKKSVNTPKPKSLEEAQAEARERLGIESFDPEPQPAEEIEPIGKTVVKAALKFPEKTPEEWAAIKQRRAEAEERERQNDILGKLKALGRDTGSRLCPMRTARLDLYSVYDEVQNSTLRRIEGYVESIEDHFENGDGVFLIGPPGTGKDHLAVSICREAVVRLQVSARWLDASSLRSQLRDAMNSSKDEKRVLGPFLRCGYLVISDPVSPGADLSDYQAEALGRLIDGRWRARRPTIITANFSGEEEAAAKLGSHVVDRLSQGSLRLLCKWESYRRRGRE